MSEDLNMIELMLKEYLPRTSDYLSGGYQQDELEWTRVRVSEKGIEGLLRVKRSFTPMDGVFHLSGLMAMVWVFQLATIFSCYDNGHKEKLDEFILRDFRLKCRRPVAQVSDIKVEIMVDSKAVTRGMIHYRTQFKIGGGKLSGIVTWFIPDTGSN